MTPGHLCRFAVRVLAFQRLEAFLGTMKSAATSRRTPEQPQAMLGRFSDPNALDCPTGFSVARPCLSECVPPSLHASSAEILICCPSAAPFGLTLGPDFPWADDPSPGTLVLSAEEILTPLIVTHTGIRTSIRSNSPSGLPSPLMERSPTRRQHTSVLSNPQLRYNA